MSSCKITRKRTFDAIADGFPESVRLKWLYREVISIHFFGRGDEMLCKIGNMWWRLEYFQERYFISPEEGYGTQTVLSSPKKVDPPTDAIYSHTEVYDWRDSLEPYRYIG